MNEVADCMLLRALRCSVRSDSEDTILQGLYIILYISTVNARKIQRPVEMDFYCNDVLQCSFSPEDALLATSLEE